MRRFAPSGSRCATVRQHQIPDGWISGSSVGRRDHQATTRLKERYAVFLEFWRRLAVAPP